MSGHSKWNTIKRQKGLTDQKRGQLFTKLLRAISVATREGGNDPTMNPRLRLAIERARSFNVPKDNIDRAIARTSVGAPEAFHTEAIGPSGTMLLIEGITDNRNRTINDLRHILAQFGGKMAAEGGTRWAFDRKGFLNIDLGASKEGPGALSLDLISHGAEDVREENDTIEAFVPPENIAVFQQRVVENGIRVSDAGIGWFPQQYISLNKDERRVFAALIDSLNNHEDVQDVWTNAE